MEVCVVGAGQGGQKLRGPGTAVATVQGEALVDLQGVASGKRDQEPLAAHVEQIFVALDAVETVVVGHLVLVDEDLVGALERWRNDEVAALVVERGQNDRRCSGLLYTR